MQDPVRIVSTIVDFEDTWHFKDKESLKKLITLHLTSAFLKRHCSKNPIRLSHSKGRRDGTRIRPLVHSLQSICTSLVFFTL